jgi:hypothetical protein
MEVECGVLHLESEIFVVKCGAGELALELDGSLAQLGHAIANWWSQSKQ